MSGHKRWMLEAPKECSSPLLCGSNIMEIEVEQGKIQGCMMYEYEYNVLYQNYPSIEAQRSEDQIHYGDPLLLFLKIRTI